MYNQIRKGTHLITLFLIASLCMAMSAEAQTFDEAFVDSTLRLDYVLAGNSQEQHIYFSESRQTAVPSAHGPWSASPISIPATNLLL